MALGGVTGCGAAGGNGPVQGVAATGTRTDSAPNLTLTRLASLTNYRYRTTLVIGSTTMIAVGAAHSPTNYQTASSVPGFQFPNREVNGAAYMYMPGIGWQRNPAKPHLDHFASDVISRLMEPHSLHLVGASVVAGVPCKEYQIAFPNTTMKDTFCVADQTGALLKYVGATTPLTHTTFVVTQVGGVPAWPTPIR